MRVLNRKTEQLECHLTAEEFDERAKGLAQACQDVGREEGNQAQIKADMKARMAALEADRSRLSLVVSRRAEVRDVRVRIEADDAKAEAITIREDTGEIVKRRALELHERQTKLADVEKTFEGPATAKPAAEPGESATDYAARRLQDIAGTRTPAQIQADAAQQGKANRAKKNGANVKDSGR